MPEWGEVKLNVPTAAFYLEGPPTSMWIQLGDGTYIQKLQKQLTSISKKSRPISHTFNDKPKIGSLYCCRWSHDGGVYRGLILGQDGMSDGYATYKVIYVDYGNSSSITADDIMELSSDLKSVPYQAVNCCLKGLEKVKEVPEENLSLITSLFQYQSCRVTFTPNIKAVGMAETKLLETKTPKYAVSLDLTYLNLENYVISNNLHKAKRCPDSSARVTTADDQTEGGSRRGGLKEKEPSAGGDTGTRGQGPPLLDPDSQDRIQDWIQQSSNQYSHRQAGDGQSKISSTKGKKVTVAESDAEEDCRDDCFMSVSSGDKSPHLTLPPASAVEHEQGTSGDEDTTQIRLKFVEPNTTSKEAEECSFSFAEDIGRIYLHLIDGKKDDDLIRLQEQMNEYFKNSEATLSPDHQLLSRLETGSLVAVSERDHWLRAETVGNEVNQWFKVQLIDYGEAIHVKSMDIRRLPKQFCKLPKMALPCSLLDVQIQDEEKALEIVKSVMQSKDYSAFRICYHGDASQIPLPVYVVAEVRDPMTADSTVKWIHDILNQSEAAVPSASRVDPNWNPMVSDYHKPENVVQPGFQCGPRADPITLTKPVKLCKFFRFNGKCVAGKKCQFKHVQTGDGFHTKHEEMVNVVTGCQARPPAVKAKIYVQITSVRTPDQFWVILPYGREADWSDDTKVVKHLSREAETSRTHLATLQRTMNELYKNMTVNTTGILVRSGEVVAAKNPRDGQWCRARVVAVDTSENLPPDQRNVEVTFVDYGENSTMKLSDTRKLKQDFLHLPFQAIECCLDRIYPPARAYNSDEFWSSAACDFLTDLAKQHKDFVAEVKYVSGTDRMSLDMYTPHVNGSGGANVAKCLVDRGLARLVRNSQDDNSHDSGYVPG